MGYNSKYKSSEIEEILDSVGGKQDVLISGENIKTINGNSIVGRGNIEIEGGGAGVYLTPFTVEQFCTDLLVGLTDEQRDELLNAALQNRIIGMPHSSIQETHETGYIITDYYYSLDDSMDVNVWSLRLSVIYNGARYTNDLHSANNPNNFIASRVGITPFKPFINYVYAEDGVAYIEDNLSLSDNLMFLVGGECTELHIFVEPSEIGKTVRFFTGESCTLEIYSFTCWANGEVPTIEPYTHYELSLVENADSCFNAVLTPFKPVE